MLYVLHGEDTAKGREKLRALLGTLQKKRPDAALLRFDSETFAVGQLDELIRGQGLFSARSIVVLDQVLEDEPAREVILLRLSDIVDSPNVFVLLEGKLDAKTRARLEKRADKMQSFDKAEASGKKEFNVFALTDALGKRDGKELWMLYQRAKLAGISDEEIHGLLFWLVKSLLLADSTSSAKEAGLNPFVHRKALGFLKHYSLEEVQNLSYSLTTLYHDARRGRFELGTALERLVLGV